jgi:predicted nucleotide-binding protein
MSKPRVFIGCSSEGKKLAGVVQNKLSDVADCKIWNQIHGNSNQTTLEWILDDILTTEPGKRYDFAILVFTADDKTDFRGEEKFAPRDNVLFELGLCMATLGRNRTFIIFNSQENIKTPSDLLSARNYQFKSPKAVNDMSIDELDNLIDLANACEKIEAEIRIRGKFLPVEERLELELGAMYRIVNAITTPAFPDIKRRFIEKLNNKKFNEAFSKTSDVINFSKEMIMDFFYPHLFPNNHKNIRIYFAYFLGDGLDINGHKFIKCKEVRHDDTHTVYEGSFIVGFSNPLNTLDADLDIQEQIWVEGNVLACYDEDTFEELFESLNSNSISDTTRNTHSETNYPVKGERSICSVPVLYGESPENRASLGVIAISHSDPRGITKELEEKALALSIMLGYVFKLLLENKPPQMNMSEPLPPKVFGVSARSTAKFRKKVLAFRRSLAKYFESNFIKNKIHILDEDENSKHSIYTKRAFSHKNSL